MLVKVKTEIEKEINIDFPVYVEYGTNLYKVVSEDKYIMVCIGKFYGVDLSSYEMEVRHGYKDNAVMIATEGRPIPPEQFDEAVVLALQHIHAIAFDKVIGRDPIYDLMGNMKADAE